MSVKTYKKKALAFSFSASGNHSWIRPQEEVFIVPEKRQDWKRYQWYTIMLYAFTETTEEKHLLIRLFIYLYNQAISEKQCIIMNITVNMPESKDQKTSFHSAAPGHV